MKNLVLAVSVVALTVPTFACGEAKKASKLTWQAVRSGESSALKKLVKWFVTGVATQLAAIQGGYITRASANVATASTGLDIYGEVFESDSAKEWAKNGLFYAAASELLRKIPGASPALDKAYGYTTADHAKSGHTAEIIKENTEADLEVRGVIKSLIATALLKLIIEEGPKLFSAAQECTEKEAQLPTVPAAA